MKSVLNLHGFDGNPYNVNYNLLKPVYGEDRICSPYIDYRGKSAQSVYFDICDCLEEYCESIDHLENHDALGAPVLTRYFDCIVGQSLGGFFALAISDTGGVPCVLSNPCVPPETYLDKLMPGKENKRWRQKFRRFSRRENHTYNDWSRPIYLFLGMEDDMLDPRKTLQTISATQIFRFTAGHSFAGNQSYANMFLDLIRYDLLDAH